jgi:nitrogen fixation/metabolism regulation signal transduction histidine kinase
MGRRVIMCACTPLPGEGEAPGGFVLVFDDITVMLQAQREAAWGEVARRLAHEIKNPLTPIRLSAERMRHKLLPSMGEKEAQVLDRGTETIVQQVEAMKEMVDAFSEYARAPRFEMTSLDLNRLVTEVTELYRAQVVGRGVRLRVSLDPRIAAIVADQGRLRQLLHNLLVNAVEALEGQPDGEIAVTTRQSQRGGDEVVEIEVADNGPGFQRELIGQVFDPYVTTKAKGTGLGLAIVRKIVEEHGGHIEADNRATGGACIRIDLPLNESTRGQASQREPRRPEPRRERA